MYKVKYILWIVKICWSRSGNLLTIELGYEGEASFRSTHMKIVYHLSEHISKHTSARILESKSLISIWKIDKQKKSYMGRFSIIWITHDANDAPVSQRLLFRRMRENRPAGHVAHWPFPKLCGGASVSILLCRRVFPLYGPKFFFLFSLADLYVFSRFTEQQKYEIKKKKKKNTYIYIIYKKNTYARKLFDHGTRPEWSFFPPIQRAEK